MSGVNNTERRGRAYQCGQHPIIVGRHAFDHVELDVSAHRGDDPRHEQEDQLDDEEVGPSGVYIVAYIGPEHRGCER